MSHGTEVSLVADHLKGLQIGTPVASLLHKPKGLQNDTEIKSLPHELVDWILAYLPDNEVYKVRPVCKRWRKAIWRRTFQQGRARHFLTESSLSPLVFYAKEDSWHFWGYDSKAEIWKRLPPFKKPIPCPDPDLFKDFHIVAHKGLFCVNVGKASEAQELYICNPLTSETYKLPPLEFPRHPVVMHVHVTLAKKKEFVTSRYWVVVIGSAAIGTEGLSRKTEVYDSAKDVWEVVGDVPGADFSINDYQTGVFVESLNLLLCVGFMVNGTKGILGFDMEKRKWREDLICPFFQLHPVTEIAVTVYFAIAHLVMCGDKVYLFSEQEAGRNVTHCLDRLDLDNRGGHVWTRVLTRQRQGNRALLVYPEFTCVPVGENKLCIFNTIEKTGVVYNMLNDPVVADTFENLPPPVTEIGIMFHSLNPVGYLFEPSFVVSALPTRKGIEKTTKDHEKMKDEKKEDMGKEDVREEDVEKEDEKKKDVARKDVKRDDVKDPASGEWLKVLAGEASVVHHEQQGIPLVVDHEQEIPVIVETAPVVDEHHRNLNHGATRS